MQTSIRLFCRILVLATGLLLVPAGQAEELSRSAMLSASCEGCHGTYGRSPGAIPTIAGKSADYLRKTLEDFRSSDTQATVMGRHVKGYTDEEIRLIAEFFSKQSEQ
jgi:sulfide dehydrogenase cytochrome subunit